MIIQTLLLIPIVFLCFFLLYIFSKQDFVLLRQNISLSEIFDLSALTLISGFLIGRIFYIINVFNFQLFNILQFFHMFRYPGISSIGFFSGGAFAIYLLFRSQKGLSRIYDIFSLSFFPFYVFIISLEFLEKQLWYLLIPVLLLSLIYFIFSVKSHSKYILRDGGISIIFYIFISLITLASQFILKSGHIIFINLTFVQIISIPLTIASCIALYLNQRGKEK